MASGCSLSVRVGVGSGTGYSIFPRNKSTSRDGKKFGRAILSFHQVNFLEVTERLSSSKQTFIHGETTLKQTCNTIARLEETEVTHLDCCCVLRSVWTVLHRQLLF